jgi:hypothetical protein
VIINLLALTISGISAILKPHMRPLFVIILLTILILPTGYAPASTPIDVSAANLQMMHTQAAQGDADAQHNLGIMYADGIGVPQDYTKARQWYEKAATQGNATAQVALGLLYSQGQGMPKDYTKARQWFEKAAAQGNAQAQFALGLYFTTGAGVPQDYGKARQWFEQAASQGNPQAQFYLGELYYDGHGVPKDIVRAYMWFNLATIYAIGDEKEFSVENRDAIAKQLSPTQVVEAQRLAQQCQAQQLKGC